MKVEVKPTEFVAHKVEYNIKTQNTILKWLGARGKKGLDGGVQVHTKYGWTVANTGAYIVEFAIDEFEVLDSTAFQFKYKVV